MHIHSIEKMMTVEVRVGTACSRGILPLHWLPQLKRMLSGFGLAAMSIALRCSITLFQVSENV